MRKKKKHIGLLLVTGVLIIGAGTLYAGRHVIVEQVKTKAAVEIGKKLLTEQFGSKINIGGRGCRNHHRNCREIYFTGEYKKGGRDGRKWRYRGIEKPCWGSGVFGRSGTAARALREV